MTAPRYRVEIVNPGNGKPKDWSSHNDRSAAEAEAAKVRKVGMFAQVRVDDDEQAEHRGDRRAFLIWALMIGAVPPARVVERVVSEIQNEATS